MDVISIIGQKGGCGKTTMTILLAGAFAYKYGKKVVVLDCDTNQQSLTTMRDRNVADSTPYKEDVQEEDETGNIVTKKVTKVDDFDLYSAVKKRKKECDAYTVVKATENAGPVLAYLKEKEKEGYDYAFIDMPGNVDNPEFNRILGICDIVFVPFIGDDLNFDSNFKFAANSCRQVLSLNSNLKKVYGFWNKYNENVRKKDFEFYCEKIKNELPEVEMLENKFGFTNAVGNRLFMNTLTAPIKWEDAGKSSALIEEMYNKVKEI